ncbi:DUF1990 family protein [Micromonosporaceae bacterium DT194]|uniref:DUF1990 family protein n=1 Tax=Melissospora conviva TaxID=3388432 RepID=UPI003C19A7A5
MMTSGSDEQRLRSLVTAKVTYAEQGATRAVLPAGYHHVHRDVLLGKGRVVFERAAEGLLGWRMHRDSGMSVTACQPAATAGAVAVLRWGFGPLTFPAACRVVYTVDEPDRRGFAYGTLPGHPVRGEEAFVVRLEPGGEVRFTITAFSRPGSLMARLGGPVAGRVQKLLTDRYIRALRKLASC